MPSLHSSECAYAFLGFLVRCGDVGTPQAPPLVLGLLCLSKRIHSIFVLRLFNDCVAMLLLYTAVYIFSHRRWKLGCVFFSLAVSIKMNILLFAPGLLLLLLEDNTYLDTFLCLAICGSIQLVLGAPFLLTFPSEYIKGSFDLGRVFMFKWTVNWKFLPEEVFVGKPLALGLLAVTLAVWALVFCVKWRSSTARERARRAAMSRSSKSSSGSDKGYGGAALTMSPDYVITTLFVSNFVGVAFARSLHYQFYSWYFHQIPLLLWHCEFPNLLRLCLVAAIEMAFNVYPATWWSSAVLQASHAIILLGILWSRCPAMCTLTDQAQVQAGKLE